MAVVSVKELHQRRRSSYREPGPWYNLIALPNQPLWSKKEIAVDPAREQTRIIKANSFVDALRPIYDYYSMLDVAASMDDRTKKIATTINEFWSALKEKMPEVFERPKDYALFRSGGIGPMHLVLRDLLIKSFPKIKAVKACSVSTP